MSAASCAEMDGGVGLEHAVIAMMPIVDNTNVVFFVMFQKYGSDEIMKS